MARIVFPGPGNHFMQSLDWRYSLPGKHTLICVDRTMFPRERKKTIAVICIRLYRPRLLSVCGASLWSLKQSLSSLQMNIHQSCWPIGKGKKTAWCGTVDYISSIITKMPFPFAHRLQKSMFSEGTFITRLVGQRGHSKTSVGFLNWQLKDCNKSSINNNSKDNNRTDRNRPVPTGPRQLTSCWSSTLL